MEPRADSRAENTTPDGGAIADEACVVCRRCGEPIGVDVSPDSLHCQRCEAFHRRPLGRDRPERSDHAALEAAEQRSLRAEAWTSFLKLVGFALILFLARASDFTLAIYQGFLLADFAAWVLTLSAELATRKTLSLAEGIGYAFLFWLFTHLGGGTWLPEDASFLGIAFLSFLVVFLAKVTWWYHHSTGYE
jgi:hypothetical protein